MQNSKSMGFNAVLNGFKTILSVIFPLITFPYVSKVLSVESVGMYNFAVSVISYVSLAASLGINTYAIRECSKYRDDRAELDKTASEIYTISVVSTIFAYTVMAGFIVFVPQLHPYKVLILILSINVIFTTIGCEWIYPVYENYMYITVRSLVTHMVSLVLLFVCVRNENDVIPYAMITVVATSGGNLLYILGRSKYCSLRLSLSHELQKHLKPIFTIFANTVTTTIYVNSDIIILKFLSSDRNVGLYSVAAKIYTVIKNLLAAVIIVSVPRLSNYWVKKDLENFHKTANKVFLTLLVIAAPAMVGLASLSYPIILLLSNQSYAQASLALQILSVALLVSVFAWFFKSSILIPTQNEDKIFRATLVASIVNIILNIILIPLFQQNAAAVTTLIAEAICLGSAYYYGKKYYRVQVKKRDWISVLLGCMMIFITCRVCAILIHSLFWMIIASVTISGTMYIGGLAVFKNTVFIYMKEYVYRKILKK